MFWGRRDTTVDREWRLTIPAAMRNQIDKSTPLKELLLKENDEGYIEIQEYLAPNNPNNSEIGDPASVFVVSASYNKKNKKGGARIKIPKELENSTSFYYGKKVTLAGKGDHLEIWPRP